MNVSRKQIDLLKDYMQKSFNDGHRELECVVSDSNLSVEDFKRVLHYCENRNDFESTGQNISLDISLNATDIRISIDGLGNIRDYCRDESLRDIPDETIGLMEKRKNENFNLTFEKFRINYKEEIPIELNNFQKSLERYDELDKVFRLKQRYSYTFGDFRLDLTVVKSTYKKSKTFKESGTQESSKKYEIEIEYTKKGSHETEEYDTYFEKKAIEFLNLIELIVCQKENSVIYSSNADIEKVEKEFMKIVRPSFKLNNSSFTVQKGKFNVGPQVKSMNIDKLKMVLEDKDSYTVTSKTDGLRMISFVSSEGILYLLSSKRDKSFMKTDIYLENMKGSMFDGEYVEKDKNGNPINHYLIFDCYYFRNEDVRSKSFDERINLVKSLKFESGLMNVMVKDFKECHSFHEACTTVLNIIKNGIYENDGLIFTPKDPVGGHELYTSGKNEINTSAPWDRLLKWKDDNTIDFRVIYQNIIREVEERQEMDIYVYDYKNKNEIRFGKTDVVIKHGKILCKNGDEIKNETIVEMSYIDGKWHPRNTRPDKGKPNNLDAANEMMAIIQFPVKEEYLTGRKEIPEMNQDIYYKQGVDKSIDENMRRFHTRVVKKYLLVDLLEGEKLLDLGSGKGGDIPRYLQSKANFVIGIDSSLDNITNPNDGANKRLSQYKKNGKDIVFLHGDATKSISSGDGLIENYKVQGKKYFSEKYSFDSISIMFAVHYMFENNAILNRFIGNIKDNLKIGGYFVGCCYDGKTIFNKLKSSKGELSFSKEDVEILNIKQDFSDEKEFYDDMGSLGTKIKVFVNSIGVEHTEYLVNFEFFKNKMQDQGFQLVHSKFFREIYSDSEITLSEEEKSASFLNRTFVFRREKIILEKTLKQKKAPSSDIKIKTISKRLRKEKSVL